MPKSYIDPHGILHDHVYTGVTRSQSELTGKYSTNCKNKYYSGARRLGGHIYIYHTGKVSLMFDAIVKEGWTEDHTMTLCRNMYNLFFFLSSNDDFPSFHWSSSNCFSFVPCRRNMLLPYSRVSSYGSFCHQCSRPSGYMAAV